MGTDQDRWGHRRTPSAAGAESTLFSSSWVRLTTTSFLPFLESAQPGLEGDVISSSPTQVAGTERQFHSLRSFLNPLGTSTQVKQGSLSLIQRMQDKPVWSRTGVYPERFQHGFFFKLFLHFIYFMCVYVKVEEMHARAHIWRSGDNFQEMVLSYHMGSEN